MKARLIATGDMDLVGAWLIIGSRSAAGGVARVPAALAERPSRQPAPADRRALASFLMRQVAVVRRKLDQGCVDEASLAEMQAMAAAHQQRAKPLDLGGAWRVPHVCVDGPLYVHASHACHPAAEESLGSQAKRRAAVVGDGV